MTLKCTVDGRPESPDHAIAVCHHCGRPVCEDHGWVVSADDAFDDSAEDPGRQLPKAVTYLAKRVPQPAMHCKQCLDDNHPRMSKHHGWADPKDVQRAAQARAAQAVRAAAQQPAPQPSQAWGSSHLPPGQQQPVRQPQPTQQWGQATGRP